MMSVTLRQLRQTTRCHLQINNVGMNNNAPLPVWVTLCQKCLFFFFLHLKHFGRLLAATEDLFWELPSGKWTGNNKKNGELLYLSLMLQVSNLSSLWFPSSPCWTWLRFMGCLLMKMSRMQPWKLRVGCLQSEVGQPGRRGQKVYTQLS